MASTQDNISTALKLALDLNSAAGNGANSDSTTSGAAIVLPINGVTPSTNLTFTDPNNPQFNVGTGIIDTGNLTGGGSNPIGNPNTNPIGNPKINPIPTPKCIRKVRRISGIYEQMLNEPVTISTPELLPEFASTFRIYKCVLKANIEECCEYVDAFGNTTYSNFTVVASNVTLAESEVSAYYKICPDGRSIKPYYETFYRLQNIGIAMPPYMPSTVMTVWGDTCNPSKGFATFEEYRDSGAYTGTIGISTDGSTSNLITKIINSAGNNARVAPQAYTVYEPSTSAINIKVSSIKNNTTGIVGNPKQVLSGKGTNPAVIMAGCSAEGECITLRDDSNTGGGGGNTETFGDPTIITETRKYKTTRLQVPTDTPTNGKRVAVPNQPCKTGIPREVRDITVYELQYGRYIYINGQSTGRYQLIDQFTEESVEGTPYIIYELIEDDPNCAYELVDSEWYTEGYAQDPCLGVFRKDVYKVYKDGRRELFQKGVFVNYFRKQDADCAVGDIRIYHPLNLGSDTIMAKTRARTKGLFNTSQSLSCVMTSSLQSTASKEYYYEVTDCGNCTAIPYFGLAYGNMNGSGSVYSAGEVNDTATRAVYSQYRLLALDQPDTQFTFYTNGQPTASNDVYVINFYRDGLSDRLDPGNFQLAFAKLNGAAWSNNVHTGSHVTVASASASILTFIDNSLDTSEAITCTQDPYTSYEIVSGTLDGGIYTQANKHTYGIVYPSLGVIVLDPYKMNTELGFNTVTGSNIAGDNAFKLFTSISGSAVSGSYMKARNVKYKTTNHYFIRVAASYGNYSSNPTYVSGSDGMFRYKCFQRDPQTYITSIGLYNDFNELLAVAKLSRPVLKSFDNDVLIKIRLNW